MITRWSELIAPSCLVYVHVLLLNLFQQRNLCRGSGRDAALWKTDPRQDQCILLSKTPSEPAEPWEQRHALIILHHDTGSFLACMQHPYSLQSRGLGVEVVSLDITALQQKRNPVALQTWSNGSCSLSSPEDKGGKSSRTVNQAFSFPSYCLLVSHCSQDVFQTDLYGYKYSGNKTSIGIIFSFFNEEN